MYRTINVSLPARRSAAAIGAAVALAAGALAVAPGAQATPATSGGGTSTATVLRAGLDVSLLNKTVDVPVNVSLNDVKAPADAKETALTVKVGSGVERGHEINILRADVATANATADRYKAEGYANVAKAEVHVPGLPLLSLIKLDAVTSKATCQVGHKPTASSKLVGVTILGKTISLNAVGTTDVRVGGVGEVSLQLTNTVTTSRTAAATALQLKVHINPLNLGVAEVTGDVTLAQATCRTPQASGSTGGTTSGGNSGGSTNGGSTNGGSTNGGSTNGGSTNGGSTNGGSTNGGATNGGSTSGSTGGHSTGGSTSGSSNGGSTNGGSSGTSGSAGTSGGGTSGGGASGSGGSDTHPQTGTDTSVNTGNLAETGASSSTPYMAYGAIGLIAVGGGAFLLTNRRRKAAASRGE
ncbi:SCO1860 family LAETG-anchored protein [Streptomyces sp. CBMA29]|uniref:SCO1860 family LAETG-anchored protein n=1 Tax=Streptomyces sp. CBMA29 TaxID=1896314 RepID=UPI002948C386|nr:SCO1860 family LAETG-anchored protein [Streptomyces sp. CBMA29]